MERSPLTGEGQRLQLLHLSTFCSFVASHYPPTRLTPEFVDGSQLEVALKLACTSNWQRHGRQDVEARRCCQCSTSTTKLSSAPCAMQHLGALTPSPHPTAAARPLPCAACILHRASTTAPACASHTACSGRHISLGLCKCPCTSAAARPLPCTACSLHRAPTAAPEFLIRTACSGRHTSTAPAATLGSWKRPCIITAARSLQAAAGSAAAVTAVTQAPTPQST